MEQRRQGLEAYLQVSGKAGLSWSLVRGEGGDLPRLPALLVAGDLAVQQRAAQGTAGLPETLALPAGLQGQVSTLRIIDPEG